MTRYSANQIKRIIGEAEEILALIPDRQHSRTTSARYRREFLRLQEKGLTPDQLAVGRDAYYVAVAAYRRGLRLQLAEAVAQMRLAANVDTASNVDIDLWIKLARQAIEWLNAHPGESERGEHFGERGRCPIKEEPSKSRSKRASLGQLPKAWRDDILRKAITANSKYKAAVAVLHFAGARGQEVQNGVTVRLVDDRLEVEIRGAKVTADTGHERRILAAPADSKDLGVRVLVAMTRAEPGETMAVNVASAALLSAAIADMGRKLWPTNCETVTAYSFRHQFSADLKADGWDAVSIAAAMGQMSTASPGHYGLARQGGRKRRPITSIWASRQDQIRINGRPPQRLRGLQAELIEIARP